MMGRIPGPLLLWYSILVFGAASSIVRVLADLGVQYAVDGRNAISFCNILFAGNACAVIVLFIIHHKEWSREKLRLLSKSDWLFLLVIALLANCLAPSFFFIAIESTMVTNVVLVSQIEPPILLLLGYFVLKDRIGNLTLIGSVICLVGVSLTVLLQPNDSELIIGRGELFAAMAAATYAIATIIGRLFLSGVPLGIFSVFRSAVGTVVFFILASYLFGPEHFSDLTSPFLWKWMLVYGALIIVTGQLAWDWGIRSSSSVDISLATSFAPIAGVASAYLILGEHPAMAHYVGGGILLLGIAIGLYASIRASKEKKELTKKATKEMVPSLDAECRAGFKGI